MLKHRWDGLGQRLAILLLCAISIGLAGGMSVQPAAAASEDEDIALDLASLLRSARAVIAANQSLINDPDVADKGLTGAVVLEKAVERFTESTGSPPDTADSESRKGRLLSAQMRAITEVMDENQDLINQPGVDFKGFVPAVFARLVNERFRDLVGQEARIKVTAPRHLVRNRKALPDEWENASIEEKLSSPDWPKGQDLTMETTSQGRQAFRFLIPEYYSEGCLACHGEPKGEVDITGYPMEGGKVGDLGGAISITLFR